MVMVVMMVMVAMMAPALPVRAQSVDAWPRASAAARLPGAQRAAS
jgi:hypothetical protein